MDELRRTGLEVNNDKYLKKWWKVFKHTQWWSVWWGKGVWLKIHKMFQIRTRFAGLSSNYEQWSTQTFINNNKQSCTLWPFCATDRQCRTGTICHEWVYTYILVCCWYSLQWLVAVHWQLDTTGQWPTSSIGTQTLDWILAALQPVLSTSRSKCISGENVIFVKISICSHYN